MTMRTAVLLTHRWIGLSTSIVLTIAGLTGAALVWDGPFPLRRIARLLHDTLALGTAGAWVVWVVTAIAVPLQIGGFILWWRRKALRVEVRRGWRRAFYDLHHLLGATGLVLMLVIAASAIGHSALRGHAENAAARDFFGALHTGHGFPFLVRVLYSVASAAFFVQSATGFVMWWKSGLVRVRAVGPETARAAGERQ